MSKPPQSAMPHHVRHTLYTQNIVQIHTAFSIFQRHSTVYTSIFPDKFSFFMVQVSVPYVNTLWTQALYIFPFMLYDAPQAVRILDNSLNSAQAHLTLVLVHASSTPPAPSVSPK